MKRIRYYNKKAQKHEWRVELTKGEQYDLIKRNLAYIEQHNAKLEEKDMEKIYRETVAFADRDAVMVNVTPTSEGHEFDIGELKNG